MTSIGRMKMASQNVALECLSRSAGVSVYPAATKRCSHCSRLGCCASTAASLRLVSHRYTRLANR